MTKIGRFKTMSFKQTDTANFTREITLSLLEKSERKHRSKMTAYDDVARKIGKSSSWLRKLIGRQPVGIDATTILNLIVQFNKLSERLEIEAENDRQKYLLLKQDHDKFFKGLLSLHESFDEKN